MTSSAKGSELGYPPGYALRVFANPLAGATLAARQSQFRGALEGALLTAELLGFAFT